MNSFEAQTNTADSEGPVDRARSVGRGLGAFSIALGTAELVAPRLIARLVGVRRPGALTAAMVRLAGVRELAVGALALARSAQPLPRWLRVAGDAMDLGMLGMAMSGRRNHRGRLAIAAAAVAGVTVLDVIASVRARRTAEAAQSPVTVGVTISRTPRQVYELFRQLERLPEFMTFLESVQDLGGGRSRWTAKAFAGKTVTWTAEITEDRPGEVIAWKTVDAPGDSPVEVDGRVTFAGTPGGAGTEVRAEIKLGVFGREPSARFAARFAKPQIKGDLRRLKQVMETGEILQSDASRHAKPHPAQPSAPEVPKAPAADHGDSHGDHHGDHHGAVS